MTRLRRGFCCGSFLVSLLVCAGLTCAARADFTTIINVPPDPAPTSIGADTQLNLLDGGELVHLIEIPGSSEVNVLGGSAIYFDVGDGGLNVSGGFIRDGFLSSSNSDLHFYGAGFYVDNVAVPGLETEGATTTINLEDFAVLSGILQDGSPMAVQTEDQNYSEIGSRPVVLHASFPPPSTPASYVVPGDMAPAAIHDQQSIAINDGAMLDQRLSLSRGGDAGVHGGELFDGLYAIGAHLIMDGGTIYRRLAAYSGSDVEISGGTIANEFGYPLGPVNIYSSTATLSGLMLGYLGIERGSTATITGETFVQGRLAVSNQSVVDMHGGTVGQENYVGGASTLNIYGGHVGDLTDVYDATINLYGGYLGYRVTGWNGARLNIFGGEIATGEYTRPLGYDFIGHFTIADGGVANVYGGVFGQGIQVDAEGELNLFVQELFINDAPILLAPGERVVIPVTRDKILSAILADGTEFHLDLTNTIDVYGIDYLHADALLTATSVVPEPSAWLLAAVAALALGWLLRTTPRRRDVC